MLEKHVPPDLYVYRTTRVSQALGCVQDDLESVLSAACVDLLVAEGATHYDVLSQADFAIAGDALCQYILENPIIHDMKYVRFEKDVAPWGRKVRVETWVKSMVRDISTISMRTAWEDDHARAWRCLLASLLLQYRYCEDSGEYFPLSRLIAVCEEQASREFTGGTQEPSVQSELLRRAVEACSGLDNPPYAIDLIPIN